jgi:hypothetical protein
MSLDFNSALNELDSRMLRLEQNSMVPTSGIADVSYDEETGTTVVDDGLDWSATATTWEPYSTISALVPDPADVNYPGGVLSTPYGRPEAHMLGSMCLLTGMVRRATGAASLPPGTRHDVPMFGLPLNRRPFTNVILPCLMGNTDPLAATSVVGTAWIEIRPGLDPIQPSGIAYYVSGTVACGPGTGWIALQGIFPCHVLDTSDDVPVEDSWDDAHFQTTWDSLTDDVTWDTYTSLD